MDMRLVCSSHILFHQSTMPVAITPRWAHTAVAFGSGPSFRVVVLFGGSDGARWLSETTLLLLGEYHLLIQVLCADFFPAI